MNDLLRDLLKLQSLDFGGAGNAAAAAEAARAEVRARIPSPILGHYDRLVVRGKKGVALVRNQVCTGCHMRLPIGVINTLMHGLDIQLCDSCGRYLCLAEEVEGPAAPALAPEPPPAKPPRKPKRRKSTTTAG